MEDNATPVDAAPKCGECQGSGAVVISYGHFGIPNKITCDACDGTGKEYVSPFSDEQIEEAVESLRDSLRYAEDIPPEKIPLMIVRVCAELEHGRPLAKSYASIAAARLFQFVLKQKDEE